MRVLAPGPTPPPETFTWSGTRQVLSFSLSLDAGAPDTTALRFEVTVDRTLAATLTVPIAASDHGTRHTREKDDRATRRQNSTTARNPSLRRVTTRRPGPLAHAHAPRSHK